MQLLVVFYNDGFAHIHFAWKILALSCTIIQISSGITHFHDNLQLAVSYVVFGLDSTIFYCIVFHKAFSVPVIMNKLKKEMLSLVKLRVRDEKEKRILCRGIRSVPSIGIKVGEFHNFERMSTPNFLGFAVKNITRMLIASRNK